MVDDSFLIGPITITHSAAASQTYTTVLAPFDLSRCQSIRGELVMTATDTDAVDTLDVKLQSLCQDGVTWNTRMYFPQMTGDMSASATAPETRILNLQNRITLDTPEESYEATGSSGGTEIAVGSVRNGAFPSKRRTSAGLVSCWRVTATVVDADSDGLFTGKLYLICGH